MRAMPSTAVKAHNRSAMAQYLYGHSHVTKQELERELGLSLPTITQNLHAKANCRIPPAGARRKIMSSIPIIALPSG